MKLEFKKGLPFLIGIASFYTLFWLLLSSVDLYALKAFTASAAHVLLGLIGVPAQLVFGLEPTIIINSISAQITNLCAGDVEIALLMAIILATWDRTWRQRAFGCIFGLLLIFIVNPIRITIVLGTGYYGNWGIANFAHDVLFRISLLIIIVLYYYIWYVKYESINTKLKKIVKKVRK